MFCGMCKFKGVRGSLDRYHRQWHFVSIDFYFPMPPGTYGYCGKFEVYDHSPEAKLLDNMNFSWSSLPLAQFLSFHRLLIYCYICSTSPVRCPPYCIQIIMWSVSTGIWWLHLRFLCCGDGHQNDSPGDFWIKVLPWWHVEPPGLLHSHGRVRNPASFSLVTHVFSHYHHCKASQRGLAAQFTGTQLGNRITLSLLNPQIDWIFERHCLCCLKWPLN